MYSELFEKWKKTKEGKNYWNSAGVFARGSVESFVNFLEQEAAQQSAQADEVIGCTHRTPRVVGDGLFACDDCGKTLRR